MAKRDARQETQSKGKSKAARHSDVTRAHKRAAVTRQEALQARPDGSVSASCLKSRQKRRRAREYAGLSMAHKRELRGSPSELGERQFRAIAIEA